MVTKVPQVLSIIAVQAGQRLDNFLVKILKGVPKSRIYRAIRKGEIRINGKRVKPSIKLAEQDQLRIPPLRSSERIAKKPATCDINLLTNRVVYEDSELLVLNKPAGIAVHGGSGIDFGVIEILRAAGTRQFLELVHRLDRETSGLLLLAKKRDTLKKLHNLMLDNKIKKGYLALLCGVWQGKERVVQTLLQKNILSSGERIVKVSEVGKFAVTEFILLKQFMDTCLMKVNLYTGRTHQIRVHAASLGCPVAGDKKYGVRLQNKIMQQLGLRRMFLHAYSLQFQHPTTAQVLILGAKLDINCIEFLTRIRGHNG